MDETTKSEAGNIAQLAESSTAPPAAADSAGSASTSGKHATVVLPSDDAGCCGGEHHHHHHHHHHEDDGALSADEDDAKGGAGGEEDDDDDPAHRIVVPSDVTTVNADCESIEWVGTVGQKITILDGLQVCTGKLRSLNLRSNLLRRMLGVRHCKGALEYLELYDNRIEALEDLDELTNLEILDISYNRIRDLIGITATGSSAAQPWTSGSDAATPPTSGGGAVIGCLRNLVNLTELFIASNKITSSWGLQNCTKLTRLDLGNNKIRKIEGLETLVNLRELWLGKNKIKRIEGLHTLVALEKLDIQSNRLEAIGEGSLKSLTNLRELYLGHNGLKQVAAGEVGHLKQLTTLDLTGNVIETLEGSGIDQCTALTDLWLGYNKLSSWAGVQELGSALRELRVVYFEHNPIAKEWEYRIKTRRLIPQLTQIDAVEIKGASPSAAAAAGAGKR